MKNPGLNNYVEQMKLEVSALLDEEFDEQEIFMEPDKILFLLTDDPNHFTLS